jgi:hydroxymethylglutaryl-CoA reductase (NADPH)
MNNRTKPAPDATESAAPPATSPVRHSTFVERRRNKRIVLEPQEPVELEFVLGDDVIRSRVLDLSEEGLSVEYPGDAPHLEEERWLANIVLHRHAAVPLQLRALITSTSRTDEKGRKVLRLYANDLQARAALWTVMDWHTFGQLGTASADDTESVRVRPIPQRGIYTEQARLGRIAYLRNKTGLALSSIQQTSLSAESLTGNIENFIGSVEVPVGVAGPLRFRGEKAQGLLLAPMATTEGALIASATRGALALTRSGGVTTRVIRQQMMRVPLFIFSDMCGAHRFANWVRDHVDEIREQALRVSRHARVLGVDPDIRGNMVTVTFLYETGDAAGQNMSTSCTWHACQWMIGQMRYLDEIRLRHFFIESGVSGDKKVSYQTFISGRGTRVIAECLLPRPVVEDVLKVTPEELVRAFHLASAFGTQTGTVGWNINVANVIAAIFAATGQDIACVHESSLGLLYLAHADGGVYASLVLPSLVVGTVGGGTHLRRQTEFLQLLGCAGPGNVSRFAEIIAGFCLALDLSTLAAITGGQFAAAHERLGRNRPVKWFTRQDLTPDFFQEGLPAALGDPSAVVESVTIYERKDTGSSIVTELTASKIDKLIGLFPVSLTIRSGAGQRDVSAMVKVKPLDQEVILMTHRLAAMCGPRVASSHARFKERIGFSGCHLRELRVYEQTDLRFRRHAPLVFRTYDNPQREAYVVVLENLAGLELMDSANDPGSWTDEHLDAAIQGVAAIHAIWYRREIELRRQQWLGQVLTAHDMSEMRPLCEDLSVHAAREFPDWFLESDLALRHELITTLHEWWPRLESLPRTLIHNDFNPRNVAFRRDHSGLRLVAYDWELATLGLPQHDLAELLCYVLPSDVAPDRVDALVERHRQALTRETSIDIPVDEWRAGFKYSLFDLAVNRVAFTIAAHTFRHFPFMERVHGTLRHLVELERSRRPAL